MYVGGVVTLGVFEQLLPVLRKETKKFSKFVDKLERKKVKREEKFEKKAEKRIKKLGLPPVPAVTEEEVEPEPEPEEQPEEPREEPEEVVEEEPEPEPEPVKKKKKKKIKEKKGPKPKGVKGLSAKKPKRSTLMKIIDPFGFWAKLFPKKELKELDEEGMEGEEDE